MESHNSIAVALKSYGIDRSIKVQQEARDSQRDSRLSGSGLRESRRA